SAKVPHGGDGAPLLGRKDEERVVETGFTRHLRHADGPSELGPYTRRLQLIAPQINGGTSLTPSIGRPANASARPRSTRSRILRPPSHVKRSSYRSRPRTPSQTARPRSKTASVNATHSPIAWAHGAVRRSRSRSASTAPDFTITSRGTYKRPARQSRPKSCQKFVSCNAVQSASEDRSRSSERCPAMRSTSRPTGLADRRE